MKELTMINLSSVKKKEDCCCTPQKNKNFLARTPEITGQAVKSLSNITRERPEWVTGILNTRSGLVPIVTTEWTRTDRIGQIRSRLGGYRMNYSVRPGLYAVGAPDSSSDVFISANYKLSFDILRRALRGISGWILVLDTRGINVWCAAGKGTFGTDELARRILGVNLAGLVSHRRIIVPQLGAAGVRASVIKKQTGFHVHFGPVDAKDIQAYIRAGYHATPEMREIGFTILRRLVLVPIELNQALRKSAAAALVILIIFGLQPSGILFKSAWTGGRPFLLFCLISIITGAAITPILLPFIPVRSFALKGWLAGAAAMAPLVTLTPLGGTSALLDAAALIFFPLMSSYLALQFTGSTTFTTISGVKKELRIWLPVYIAGLAISIVIIILYKLQSWRII
ncbi:MAG: acetyl-CoA synthase subunit gamma [Spirochaetes bacterium]|nr:acetyl-CoA synthase subunit gamma [Spirochaetota bacterium]